MWRWLIPVTIAACGGSATPATPPVDARPQIDPTTTAFCRLDAPVDRVDRVLDCTDRDHRYVEPSVRRTAGWTWVREQYEDPFTADESAHLDVALADGVKTICAGASASPGTDRLGYPSLHTEELGWPMWACFGDHLLVLHRGDAALELRDPLVEQMQLVFWVVGVHQLGMMTTWKQ